LRYRQFREETKECLLTPKLRKPWNGKEEREPEEMKEMKEMSEVMNCREPQPLVWR